MTTESDRPAPPSTRTISWPVWMLAVILIPGVLLWYTWRYMLPPKLGSAIRTILIYPFPMLGFLIGELGAVFCYVSAWLQFPAYGFIACRLAKRRSWIYSLSVILIFHVLCAIVAAGIFWRPGHE